jgi:MFS family permease
VIFASSLGTVFEWYDFYLYGSLAAIIAKQFFSGLDAGSAFIFALLAFAAGFIVRPFGAIFFGRLGDMIGRKYTFLVTILIMGLSTFIVGILPTYASIGVAAPIILIILRLLQGLALGGEYGGAATYVAEHAPHGKRGAYTAWIQTTATLGLFLSLLVILGTRTALGEAAFADWGWRIPFLVSIALLAISVWIRLSHERIARLPEDEGRGQDLQGAADRVLRPVEEPEDRDPGAGRPDGRPGRGLVHGPVLCAVLPDAGAEGRPPPPT